MEAADTEARALREAGPEGQAERVRIVTAALDAYGRAFVGREAPARERERADSLAGILWDRAAFSYHALGDTAAWAAAAGQRLRFLHTVDDSARVDELRRGAYAVGFGDYVEGVRRLREAGDYALARGDTAAYVAARHCELELVRQHGGAPVPVALQAGGAEACAPTDARALWLAAVFLLGAFVLWVELHLGLLSARAPYLYR